MGGSGLLWIGRALILLQLASGVLGWGKEGHFALCKIAAGFLSEETLAAVRELLPDSAEGDLANVCSWPDEIRFRRRWTGPLHYINTPDVCNYEYHNKFGDCHDSVGLKDRCVAGAINNYTMQLISFNQDSESQYNLTEALMFLSHFMGDVHQPLPVGFAGDEGGNTIVVRWFRRKTNLHHVWDDMVIESAMKKFYDSNLTVMIQSIEKSIGDDWANDISSWKRCGFHQTVCPNRYASESIGLACDFAYRDVWQEITLRDDYFLSRLPVVEKRLAQGGIRLAATLNRIFASQIKIAQA